MLTHDEGHTLLTLMKQLSDAAQKYAVRHTYPHATQKYTTQDYHTAMRRVKEFVSRHTVGKQPNGGNA